MRIPYIRNKSIEYFTYEVEYTQEDFIWENFAHYEQAYLETFPQDAYKINDWDVDIAFDYFLTENKDVVIDDMCFCYWERLAENYLL